MNTPPPTCVYFVAVNPKQPSGGLSIFRTPVAVPVMFGVEPNIIGYCNSSGGGPNTWTTRPPYVTNEQNTDGYSLLIGVDATTQTDVYYLLSHADMQSSVYGAAQTVQPASLRLLPCIKF